MKEVLEPGDRVKIRVTPGCDSEMNCHAIMPIANKFIGVVVQFRYHHCKNGHDYIVKQPDGHNGYYRRDELELLTGTW